MKIVMLGAGYVGLVSGACFAEFGVGVTCVDPDEGKIARLHDGIIPIYEPGLDDLVAKNVDAGRLTFATSLSKCAPAVDAVFIAVGTLTNRTYVLHYGGMMFSFLEKDRVPSCRRLSSKESAVFGLLPLCGGLL